MTEETAEYRGKLAAGTVIAERYILQSMIGEGGMGEVWVAKQIEPVKRKVALKLIKPGMDSRAVLQRFEQERQALAMMDHPNIAKVLDGGVAQSGQPFFVMELVCGLPLTKFCDDAKLTPKERLELFVPICQAIQHAHQKGVVHRDLKPANILVTLIDAKPVPKVIDFGVAKATGGKLTDESLSTQFGSIVGTLEYMSPEQAGFSGIDIDTRADIYSLGVILYELLTGLRPLDAKRLREAALTEMIRVIREEEPSKPSTRLSTDESLPSLAALRQTEPRKLMGMLRGDLDWVVMKCLEKQRERRYETASGLARDVQRYLSGDPVEACPPSAAYRIRKFARKHRAGLITAAGFAALLALATAVSTYQAVRATRAERRAKREADHATAEANRAILAEEGTRLERDRATKAEAQARTEADKAKAINDFLTTDLLTQAEPAGNAAEDHVTLLEVLDRAAGKVGERFAAQPEVEVALRKSMAQTYHGLASWEKAERQVRALLELARRPGSDRADLYNVESQLAHVLDHRGRYGEGVGLARSAAEGLARVLGPDHPDTIAARGNLAVAYLYVGRPGEAIPLLEATLKQSETKLGPDHPRTLATRQNLAAAYQDAGRSVKAIPLLEAALKETESRFGRGHPSTLTTRDNLASAYRGAGRAEEAIAVHKETLKQMKSTLGPDHPDTLKSLANLAADYYVAGHKAEAIPLLEATRKRTESTLGPDHPDTLKSLTNLADVYQTAGRGAESEVLYRQLLERQRTKQPAESPALAAALALLGRNLLIQKKWTEAEPVLRECLAIRAKTLPDDWATFSTRSMLGGALLRQKKFAESEPLLLQGYEEMKKQQAKIPPRSKVRVTEAAERLVQLYEANGKPGEAAKWRKELEASKASQTKTENRP